MTISPLTNARAPRARRRVRPVIGAAIALTAAALAPAALGAPAAGTLDAPWGGTAASNCTLASGNTGYNFCARAIAVLPDGKVLVGGGIRAWGGASTAAANTRLYRLNADGTVDGTFPEVTVPSGFIYSVAVNAQGDIFVGGNITSVTIDGATTPRENVFALNSDGTLKASFDPNNAFTGGVSAVFAMAPTTNGGVIIGGETDSSCTTRGWCFLARLDGSGALDTGFAGTTPGTSANDKVYAVTAAPGGGYYIGGEFTQYKGQTANYVARIREDGSRDTTFSGGGANDFVWSVAPQGTQGVVVGGSFSTYDGQTARGLARAKTDGSIDTTFSSGANWGATIGGSAATVFTVAVEPAGRILAGGNFDTFGLRDAGGSVTGTTVGGIVGLNADGTSDATFNTAVGAGANASGTGCTGTITKYLSCRVGAFAATPDSIFVGGTFTTFSGTSNKNSLVRLANDAKGVTVTTSGQGTVTSEPAGLDCGSTCTTYVRDGGTITLTATPAAGATFLGWGGACSGTALTCTLTLSSNQTVEARFSEPSKASSGAASGGAASGGVTAKAAAPKVSRAGVISVRVTTTGAGVVRITGTRTSGAVACTARRTFRAASSATMRCVTSSATRAARRKGPVKVRLAMRFTPTGGTTTRTTLRTVTLPRFVVPAVVG